MKKETFIISILLLGFSLKSIAGTGYADDGLNLILVFSGILLVIVALLSVIDWLQKNGKSVIYKSVTFLKGMINFLKGHLHKATSDLYY